MTRMLQTIAGFNPIFLNGDLHGLRYDVDALAEAFLAEGRKTPRDVVSGIFEYNARGMGKSRWGDKTPYYALHLDKLVDWWPDARIIHLVRDGRDVALSLFGRRHDFSAYNIFYAAQYWKQYVDVCRAQGARLPAGQYLELRYEDVLDDKPAALARVCDFLGVRSPVATTGAHRLKTVRKDNQGKWKNALGAWALRVFESEAGDTLAACGYPLACPGQRQRLPRPLRAVYHLHTQAATRLYRLLGRNRRKLRYVAPAP
jgi:hypothetical protein